MTRQPEKFPELVKEIRRQLGISQEGLAHALGVSFATVNRWENSRTAQSKLARAQFEALRAKLSKQRKLKHDPV